MSAFPLQISKHYTVNLERCSNGEGVQANVAEVRKDSQRFHPEDMAHIFLRDFKLAPSRVNSTQWLKLAEWMASEFKLNFWRVRKR